MKIDVKEIIIVAIFLFLSAFVFRDYFLKNSVPFPANLLAAFYEPWVSYKWEGYPNGPPAKPLGFDNLRIYYPTRQLIVEKIRNWQFPLWNPYVFSGNTLLGTYQSAVFHPFGFIFFFLPQVDAWSVIIIFQPFLTGIFTYLFLKELGLSRKSGFFGGMVFAFSGIMVVWWEEMFMAVYSVLFLPLILWSIEKLYKKISFAAFTVLVLSLSFSVFSGWFQGSFYVWFFSFLYVFSKFLSSIRIYRTNFIFIVSGYFIALALCGTQLVPGLEAYLYSVRSASDFNNVFREYLASWKHLITFAAPDFFGSPAVHNYYGPGFYHERILFVGISGIIFALYEFLNLKKNNFTQKFFKVATIVILSLGFNLPLTWFLLYNLHLPFLSQMNPTRIFFLSSFGLSILSAYGIERYFLLKNEHKKIFFAVIVLGILVISGWYFAVFHAPKDPIHTKVPFRNMIFPTILFASFAFSVILGSLVSKLKNKTYFFFILITLGSIYYFTNKYLYFSDRKMVFPDTAVLSELKKISGIDRFWTVGDAYMHSNLSSYYHLYSPEGYDSFNIARYNELIYSSHTNGKLSYEMPRSDVLIYKSKNMKELMDNPYRLKILEILGVKHVVSSEKDDILPSQSEDFKKIWTDNVFSIYEYKKALPRIFMADNFVVIKNKQKILERFYDKNTDLKNVLILEQNPGLKRSNKKAEWTITSFDYHENDINIRTKSNKNMLLFVSDNYFPGWKAYIDGQETKIFRADYNFRAVNVPAGVHKIFFVYKPLSFYIGILISVVGIILFIGVFVYLKKIRVYVNQI